MSLPPQIPDSEWLELVSPTDLREGKALAEGVRDAVWEAPCFRGTVSDGETRYSVLLDLRSRTFPRVDCACRLGQARRICRHAIAVYFAYFAPLLKAAELARQASRHPIREPAVSQKTSSRFSAPLPPVKTAVFSERSENTGGNTFPQIDGGSEWISLVLPIREHPHYGTLRELVNVSGFVLDARSRRWFLRGEHKMLNFLAAHRDFIENTCRAKISLNFRRVLQRLKTAEIRCEAKEQGEAFELSVGLETFGLSESEVASALACGKRYARCDNGRTVLLPEPLLEKIANLRERLGQREITGTENTFRRRFSRAELPSAESVLLEVGVGFVAPEAWRERSLALRDLSHLAKPPVPDHLFSQLRLYQQIGVAWLWHLHKNELGGLLADEMGLGKTVQAIAYLAAVFSEENASGSRTALLVVPAGLIENWRRELIRFTPEIPVRVHHGQRRSTESPDSFSHGVVLTSYSTLAIDLDFFRTREWHSVIADEAQQIKNRRSRNSRALKEVVAKTRFVLTGTPIENSYEDLRSLFEFLMPGFLPNGNVGRNMSDSLRKEWERTHLKTLVAPYILRRTKSAVAPELPPRIEQTLWCRFGDVQGKLYDDWKTRSREEFFKLEMSGASDARLRIAAFSQLLRLRQICTEPRILDATLTAADSAKLRAFRELLDEARVDGHRMLVFSQFVTVLDFLADALTADGVPFCRIDGSTKKRSQECERFNKSPEIPVFLISLKAGGLGLNITGADIVVHYDPWWNPAAEAQATDRAHRIGQTRTVTAIKLVVADSVEEHVLSLQRDKRHLLAELFEASEPAAVNISLAEIKELLC